MRPDGAGPGSGRAGLVHADERGLTTLEYVIAAGIILVVLSAAILAWNQGLATKIGDLVRQLTSG